MTSDATSVFIWKNYICGKLGTLLVCSDIVWEIRRSSHGSALMLTDETLSYTTLLQFR